MTMLTLTDQERVELVARMVRELLREHQLAGCFFLSAPTHCANAIMYDTAPWLRLKLEVDAEGKTIGARMRSKLEEYRQRGMSEAEARVAQTKDTEATISTLDFLGTRLGELALVNLQLADQAQRHFNSVTTGNRVGDAWGGRPS